MRWDEAIRDLRRFIPGKELWPLKEIWFSFFSKNWRYEMCSLDGSSLRPLGCLTVRTEVGLARFEGEYDAHSGAQKINDDPKRQTIIRETIRNQGPFLYPYSVRSALFSFLHIERRYWPCALHSLPQDAVGQQNHEIVDIWLEGKSRRGRHFNWCWDKCNYCISDLKYPFLASGSIDKVRIALEYNRFECLSTSDFNAKSNFFDPLL